MDTSVIVKNPEILGGVPVFVGTRVPFQALLDYPRAVRRLMIPRRLSHRDARGQPLVRSKRPEALVLIQLK
jgi:hypothetical protein